MIQTLEVQNLSCGGCCSTIRTALDLAGFKSVRVEIRTNPHTVSAEVEDDEHLELMKVVLRGHGYPLLTDDKIEIPDETKLNFA